MLDVEKPVGTLDLFEKTNPVMEFLNEAMQSTGRILNAYFGDSKNYKQRLPDTNDVKSKELLLCEPPYKARNYSRSKNSSHDLYKPYDMDNFCNIAK